MYKKNLRHYYLSRNSAPFQSRHGKISNPEKNPFLHPVFVESPMKIFVYLKPLFFQCSHIFRATDVRFTIEVINISKNKNRLRANVYLYLEKSIHRKILPQKLTWLINNGYPIWLWNPKAPNAPTLTACFLFLFLINPLLELEKLSLLIKQRIYVMIW